MAKNTNVVEQVLEAFQDGESLTSDQIRSRFGVARPTDVVRRLRQSGYCIYANPSANGQTSYRLGKPSREMIAAAYKVWFGKN